MIEEIQRMYQILNELRRLENNVNHEANMDMYNLRRGIRHLTDFYEDMQVANARALEDKKSQAQ